MPERSFCAECGETFTKNAHNQVYCSQRCKRDRENALRRQADDALDELLHPTPGGRSFGAPPLNQDRAELPDFDGRRGELKVTGGTSVKDWREVLEIALPPGFDADEFDLVGNPRVTSHTILKPEHYDDNDIFHEAEWVNVQAWWKIQFARKDVLAEEGVDEDAERLHDELEKWPIPNRETFTGNTSFVVNLADLQIGQADDGGSAITVARLNSVYEGIVQRVRDLKKLGVPLGEAVIAGLGDLVESCNQNYEMQTFTVDLHRRQQTNVVRRMIYKLIKLLMTEGFEQFTIVAVPGNHGEHRQNGKAFTELGDNDDLAVFDQLYDIISETKYADMFRWKIPQNEMVVTANLSGRVVGWTHGHLAKGGGTPQKKLWNWWEKQCMGRRDLAAAEILVTGHYHHFSVVEDDGRHHFQCPAMCGTSMWWEGMTGQGSIPGTLTFVVDPDGLRPYSNLQIISPN